jgi:hypothetical protein
MVAFLFWNTARRLLYDQITSICGEADVDVAIFTESALDAATLTVAMSTETGRPYFQIPALGSVQFYTRYPSEWFESRYDDNHISVKHLTIAGSEPILLVAIRLPSKLYSDHVSGIFHAQNLAEVILQEEAYVGHTRTVVIW